MSFVIKGVNDGQGLEHMETTQKRSKSLIPDS